MTSGSSTIVAVALALNAVAAAQTLNPPARAVAAQGRPLTQAEVAQVVGAARNAIAGRTFRLSYQPGGPGPEVLMGSTGRP
jgi:hypothetical protein